MYYVLLLTVTFMFIYLVLASCVLLQRIGSTSHYGFAPYLSLDSIALPA